MDFLEALLSGAKVLLKETARYAGTFIREIVREIDDTHIGKIIGRVATNILDKVENKAADLAGEEADIYQRAARDGKLDAKSRDRLKELEEERDKLRAELDQANKERAARELSEHEADVKTVDLNEDEVSANTDLVTSKECPNCGGTMRLRQGNISLNTGSRKFYWQCADVIRKNCPTITYKLDDEKKSILRRANPDFDLEKSKRDSIWGRDDVTNETHRRLRNHLGDEDQEMICPVHLLRMKMLPKRLAGGRMLDSYEYVCLGVSPDGTACKHVVPVKSKPQVAEILRRKEGQGIIA